MLDSDGESSDSEEDAEAVSDSGSEFSEDGEAGSASESDADSSDVADPEEEEDIKPAAKRQKKVRLTIPVDTARILPTCKSPHSGARPACVCPYASTVNTAWVTALSSHIYIFLQGTVSGGCSAANQES